MYKKELISEVASASSRIQRDTARIINAVFDVILEAIRNGDVVDIPNFGRFEIKIKNGRKSPVFVPSKDLKLIIKYNL